MENRQQIRGRVVFLGSPKVVLGQVVATALFAILVLCFGPSAASVGAEGQAPSMWGQPTLLDLGLLPWVLVVGLSSSAMIGLVTGRTSEISRAGGWARAGLLTSNLGLLIAALGSVLGQAQGFRGQVLVPRSGTADIVRLPDGNQVKLPFTLEHRPGLVGSENDSPLPVPGIDTDLVVVRDGRVGTLPKELSLYPAGEMRVGASGTLRVLDRSGSVLLEGVAVQQGDVVPLPAGDTRVEVAGLWNNRNELGPAAKLVLREPARGTEEFLVFRALPGWDKGRGDNFVFQMTSFIPGREYLRFWVVKDPGLPLAAAGGLLLFFGSLGGLAGRQPVAPFADTRHPSIISARFRRPHFPSCVVGRWGRTQPTAGSGMNPEASDRGERCVQA